MSLALAIARIDQIERALAPPSPAPVASASAANGVASAATAVAPAAAAASGGFAGALQGATGLPYVGSGGGGAAMPLIAGAELGQAEQPPGSNDSSRIATYRTATAGSGVGPWCAYFVSWVARQVTSFAVPFRMTEPFVMIAASPGPGAAWSAETYGALASELMDAGQVPVLVGLDVPAELCAAVQEICPAAVDLTGKATVNELVFMAWAATAVVGPDNGVMQLAAAAGCRAVVLFNAASDPALVGPRGARVTILRRPSLAEISVGEVMASLFKK